MPIEVNALKSGLAVAARDSAPLSAADIRQCEGYTVNFEAVVILPRQWSRLPCAVRILNTPGRWLELEKVPPELCR